MAKRNGDHLDVILDDDLPEGFDPDAIGDDDEGAPGA